MKKECGKEETQLNVVGFLGKSVYISNVAFTAETDMLSTLINMLCSIINENVGFA